MRSDSLRSFAFSLTAALALSACGGESPAPAGNTAATAAAGRQVAPPPAQPVSGPRISGRIEVTDLSELPAGLQLSIKLRDITDPSVVPPVVAESLVAAPRLLPADFQLGYDTARIDQARRYVVEAALQTDGVVLYGTPQGSAALTQGAPSEGMVLNLVRGGQAVAPIAPADQLKKDFQALEANLGALRRITGERLDDQVAIGWDAFVDASGQVRMAREQVELAEGGNSAYRFAYQGGQPWVVERKQGGVTTLLGWTSEGQLLINDKGGAPVSDQEIATLRQRAADLYGQAAAKR